MYTEIQVTLGFVDNEEATQETVRKNSDEEESKRRRLETKGRVCVSEAGVQDTQCRTTVEGHRRLQGAPGKGSWKAVRVIINKERQ